MNLPDPEALCTELGHRLNQLISDKQLDNPMLVGIRSGGVWIAQRLQQQLSGTDEISTLNISFYRDDFTRNGLHPNVEGSDLLESIEDRHIILVDDVIMSGRTIRAAMNELFDYGRPASIHLLTLLDIGHRELPVQPDICGATLELADDQQIKLQGPEPLTLTLVTKSQ